MKPMANGLDPMTIDQTASAMLVPERCTHWRMGVAAALWIGGFFLPLAIPPLTSLPLAPVTKATLSALLVFGLPQLLTVVAIAIVGKPGFHYLMEQLSGAAKRLEPSAHVSRSRYRAGLVMLFLPLAMAVLEAHVAVPVGHEGLPHWLYAAINDTLFLTSFFVLGGDFWDKVKALFIYEARAVLPAEAARDAP